MHVLPGRRDMARRGGIGATRRVFGMEWEEATSSPARGLAT